MVMSVVDGKELGQLLDSYRSNAIVAGYANQIRCIFSGASVWKYQLRSKQLEIAKESVYSNHVFDAYDMCGAVDMSVSFLEESMNLSDSEWDIWFAKKIEGRCLIFDTNFILRHYFSNILTRRISREQLILADPYLPNMVILEIERRGNEKEKKSNALGYVEGKAKRVAFYGIKEIQSIREKGKLYMIPLSPSVGDFSRQAGSGFADAMIRQEIHNMTDTMAPDERVIFLTCDLMNSMAAEAEGITSCYFSRLPCRSYYLDEYANQLLEFIIANTIIFNKVTIQFLKKDGTLEKSYDLEGVWEGKTTSEWYSDSLRIDFG